MVKKQFDLRKTFNMMRFMIISFGLLLLSSANFASAQLDLVQEGAADLALLPFDMENDDYEGVFVPFTRNNTQNLIDRIDLSTTVLLSKIAGGEQSIIVQDPGGLFVDIKLFEKLDDSASHQFLNDLEDASRYRQLELTAGQIAADWPYPDRGAGGPGIHDSCLAIGCAAMVISNPTAPTAELSMDGYLGLYIERSELEKLVGSDPIDPLINFVVSAPWLMKSQESLETLSVCAGGIFNDVIGGDCFSEEEASVVRLITADILEYDSEIEGIWIPNYAIANISDEILRNFASGGFVKSVLVKELNAPELE